jgi:hypothetical protein
MVTTSPLSINSDRRSFASNTPAVFMILAYHYGRLRQAYDNEHMKRATLDYSSAKVSISGITARRLSPRFSAIVPLSRPAHTARFVASFMNGSTAIS